MEQEFTILPVITMQFTALRQLTHASRMTIIWKDTSRAEIRKVIFTCVLQHEITTNDTPMNSARWMIKHKLLPSSQIKYDSYFDNIPYPPLLV